jgi:hypothetical protein
LTGDFDVIGFLGGLIEIDSGETGLNISGIGTIDDDAFLSGTSFVGSGTRTVGTFAKQWEIDTPGLNTEKDDIASGTIYMTTPIITPLVAANTPVKVLGITNVSTLFRFDTNSTSNRLRYIGTKTRVFSITGSLSMTSTLNNQILSFYIAKNGTIDASTLVKRKIGTGSDLGATGISGSILLEPNDYIELWVANGSSLGDITVQTMNLRIN